jgi:hypothetical protein
VFPDDPELAGDHTIEVVLTASYTNWDIIPFLVDELGLLSGSTVTLYQSFDMKITIIPTDDFSLPQEGPSFDTALTD